MAQLTTVSTAVPKETHNHTYSLNPGEQAQPYYATIRLFANRVQQYMERHRLLLANFAQWRSRHAGAAGYTSEETLEDMAQWLALAVRLHSWGRWCSQWSSLSTRAVRGAAKVRRRYRRWGDGALALLYGTSIPEPETRKPMDRWTLTSLEQMVRIMEALPDFAEEGTWYRQWFQYAESLDLTDGEMLLAALWNTARWFTAEADTVLGTYTCAAPLQAAGPRRNQHFREDRILRSLKPVDYHLALVTAELLNQAYRREFSQTRYREVLVPACLCGPNCQRQTTEAGVRCQQCGSLCPVGRLATLGTKFDFGVLVISHASRAFPGALDATSRGGVVGIVGIACPAHLLAGGWSCRRRGIPAQCVPLEFAGCRHWSDEPMQTRFDMTELLRLVRP